MVRVILLVLTVALLTAAPVLSASDSESGASIVRFSVLLKGKVVGSHVSTRRDNELEVHFEYSDRGRDDRLGSIVPGKFADMILVDGNPDEDISQIRNTSKVIRNGVIHDSAALYQALEVR